jgi:hypothetical protein
MKPLPELQKLFITPLLIRTQELHMYLWDLIYGANAVEAARNSCEGAPEIHHSSLLRTMAGLRAPDSVQAPTPAPVAMPGESEELSIEPPPAPDLPAPLSFRLRHVLMDMPIAVYAKFIPIPGQYRGTTTGRVCDQTPENQRLLVDWKGLSRFNVLLSLLTRMRLVSTDPDADITPDTRFLCRYARLLDVMSNPPVWRMHSFATRDQVVRFW